MSEALVLAARGLTVAFGAGERRVEVLRAVDFSLARGRVLGLVGESGAGKSMIARVLAGTLPAGFHVAGGTLDGLGENLAHAPRERRRALLGDRIAFVPQEPLTALDPLMTIAAQFGEHLARLGVPAPERRERILAELRAVRLREPEALLKRYPFQLSGGMCQRVLIAMAFAGRPALLVADEPTTALDVSTQAHIVDLIRAMQAEHGTAALFITHDLRLAARVCDDILVLYAGEAVEYGPARAVIEAPRHPYTASLQAANPSLEGPLTRLASLPDRMPSLAALRDVPGCRFAPRCPVADPACAAAPPVMVAVEPGHAVRCAGACLREGFRARLAEPLSAASPFGPVVLAVESLTKTFPGRRDWIGRRGPATQAVRDVSLSVREGEFVGVVGESGSGKSTLARLVMGLETPTEGRIQVDGRDVTAPETGRAIRLDALQMIFQDAQSALNPRRSVLRLVTQALEARGHEAGAATRLARARALLAETGLPPDFVDRYPAQLSGGQKQRVAIARALCVTARLLVADEVVSGLDVSVQAQILNLLLDLRRERRIGLLIISHDLAVVRYLCTHVHVMREGTVVESGPVEMVFADPRHPYTRALLAAVPPDDLDRPWPAEAVGE